MDKIRYYDSIRDHYPDYIYDTYMKSPVYIHTNKIIYRQQITPYYGRHRGNGNMEINNSLRYGAVNYDINPTNYDITDFRMVPNWLCETIYETIERNGIDTRK